ncbi:MAG: hypothetical protein ACTS3R_04030 [Inquilinaceae bacterium]
MRPRRSIALFTIACLILNVPAVTNEIAERPAGLWARDAHGVAALGRGRSCRSASIAPNDGIGPARSFNGRRVVLGPVGSG